jgi:2',3'-cyclic-nucleotide 2'-phosphodiesterase (5'-nucleotidase family)
MSTVPRRDPAEYPPDAIAVADTARASQRADRSPQPPSVTLPLVLLVVVSLGVALLASALLVAQPLAGGTDQADGWLTILHTNDVHGAYDLREATWRDDRPLVGGYLALSGTVEAVRAERPVLLVDAGDLMTGNPLTVIDHHGVMGGCAMALMNAMGYDAMALGNHEFDNGRPALDDLLGMAEFPVLAANLWVEETGEALLPAHTIVEKSGVRVALIGLILEDLASVVDAVPLRGLRVEPVATAARREIGKLDPLSDLIVVVLHAGIRDARELAAEVGGIDIIIAGHDHQRTRQPIEIDGTLIVETGSRLTNLGRLDVRVVDDRVVEHRFELILLEEAATAGAVSAVVEVRDECHAAIEAEYGVEIATLVQPFRRSSRRESNVGNWVTDVMREAVDADFAIANSSGLRADIEAGPLTRLDIHQLMPFRNLLSVFECSGRELERLAALNAARSAGQGGSVVQLSGLRYRFDADGNVHDLEVGGQPIDLDGTYTGATSDFVLFSQAERYLGFVPAKRERTTLLLTDLLASAATRQSRIDVGVEGRFEELAGREAPQPISVSE